MSGILGKPDNITTYMVDQRDGEGYYMPADCAFTTSAAWDTIERRASDSTKTVQNIALLRRRGKQPATYQISFIVRSSFDTQDDIFDMLAQYESIVGHNVRLYYSNFDFGLCIISDGAFALSCDSISGVYALSVSYNLKESIVYTPGKVGDIRA